MTPVVFFQLACFLLGGAALLGYLAYRAMRR
jgi:hypothetical protein